MRFNLFRKLFFAVAGTGLAILAVGAAVVPGAQWFGLGLAAAALGVGWWHHRLDGLGEHQLARAGAVIALLVSAVGATSFSTALPALLAGTALLLLVGYEQLLAIAMSTRYLESVNLAVHRPLTARLFVPRAVYGGVCGLSVALLAATAALMATGSTWPSWIVVAGVAAVGGGLAAGTLGAWRQRRRSAHSGDPAVSEAVNALRPEFLIHFSGPAGSEYQLEMWLPYFDRLGDPYLIVLRDRTHLPRLAAATSSPIVVVPGISALENLLIPSVQAVFYVNNSMQNTQLVRFGRLTHVQLMHGDSDKAVSRNPVAAMYDLVFVAGPAGMDRYHHHGVDIPERRFRFVGRPQLHDIVVGPRPSGDGAPVVLYTPTWTGMSSDVDYSSLRIGGRIVSALLARGAVVLLRAHPYTRYNAASARQLAEMERLLEVDAERSGRPHRWGAATSEEMSLVDCVNAADAAVSDVSGAASDWLYSGKPFALTDMHGKGADFVAEFPLAAAAYRVEADGGNIEPVLDELLDTDSKAEDRVKTRSYYLGDIPPDRCVEAFLDEARACYREG